MVGGEGRSEAEVFVSHHVSETLWTWLHMIRSDASDASELNGGPVHVSLKVRLPERFEISKVRLQLQPEESGMEGFLRLHRCASIRIFCLTRR